MSNRPSDGMKNMDEKNQFSDRIIHLVFAALCAPIVFSLNYFVSISQIILLTTFCFIICGYSHFLFHERLSAVHKIQIEILTSMKDILVQKMNTQPLIYIEGSDDESDMTCDSRIYDGKTYDRYEKNGVEKKIPVSTCSRDAVSTFGQHMGNNHRTCCT